MRQSDDQLIISYIKSGNDAAFEEIVKRYLPLVFYFVRKYTANIEDASDISQEVFVKVWKNIKKFDTSKNFKTWLFIIAKRTAIDLLKKKRALPFSEMEKEGKENFADSLADNSQNLSEQIISKEFTKNFSHALTRLSSEQSLVIDMHINEGLNFREIAESTKQSLNTIKSRYLRGMAILRSFFK